MNLSFSANAYKKSTLEAAIDSIADVGYRGIEIMADAPHALPADMPPARRAAVRRQLAARGLALANINAFTLFAAGDTYHPTWIEHDPDARQRRIQHTFDCIRLAADLGSPSISLQPGGPLIGTGLTRAEAARRFADGLAAVLPAARDAGVILAIEPEPGLYLESAAEWMEFKSAHFADEPLVKMNCDIGHHFCVGEDPAAVIEQYAAHIVHLHIEDIGANRVHMHLPLGDGAIDFDAVFAAADRVGYSGWFTVELYPYVSTAQLVAQAAFARIGQTRAI